LLNVWLFPKWYPNRIDPQLGVFIQKHARAISLHNKVTVLYVQSLDVLDSKYETEQFAKEYLREIFVYYKKYKGPFSKVINFSRYIMAIRMAISIAELNHSKPDILQAYILLRPAIVTWYLARRKNIPYVVSEQWSGYLTGKFESKNFITKIISRRIAKDAGALTSVSKFLKDGMESNGLSNKNIFVIPNCIEINKQSAKISSGKTYVLLVADLVDDIKNISAVIRTVAKIDSTIPFELHIIGHGRDEQMLKKLTNDLNVTDRVFFEGLKTNEEVYEYLNRCDFLVMNSRYETFSLICAESMSVGKPVLATRCGGPNEFITPDTGILIEPDDDEELFKAFKKMLNDFNTFDSEKIIAHSKQLFSIEVAAQGFQQALQRALSK
jgi:glycosyltransferase involved in cell wall biosynthesis